MKINRGVIVGIIAGLLVMGSSAIFYFIPSIKSINLFYFLLGVGFLITLLPFVVMSVIENKIEREKDEMFLEFARGLVESVESGTPISKSIVNLKAKNFGSLSPHIEKLSNQIELGIPIKEAFETFAFDTKSKTIIRAITLIREAEKTGGSINNILESVASSVSEIEKLKAERRAAISAIVLEGYIIFFIFIIIMVVMEIEIIPMTVNIAGLSSGNVLPNSPDIGSCNQAVNSGDFSAAFLSLLIAQGLFAGLIIGKLSEGTIKAGMKHSFIMVSMAILISTGSRLILNIK